jgi:hypothetical protein
MNVQTPLKDRGARGISLRWFVIAGIVAILVWWPFRFSWFSVCSHCGCVRYSVARQLPFAPVTYWTSHTVEQTPLSRSVAEFVTCDTHDWQFAAGGGNGITCAIGFGRHLRQCTESAELIAFIAATAEHDGPEAAKYYLELALSPEHSDGFLQWLDMLDFDPAKHSDRDGYKQWLEQATPYISEFGEFSLYSAS